MALSVKTVRQRVVAAITGGAGLSSWREASDPYDVFGAGGDGENRLHQSYAVGVPTTATLGKDRQRPADGTLSDTRVGVRWSLNVSALDQVASYDAGLDAEQLLLAAVLTIQQSEGLLLRFASSSRTVSTDGWMNGEIFFTARHQLPLA